MIHRSTIQLLRFHFSLFLLPVFLFALSQSPGIDWTDTILVFIILHILVYPSSNGYNSYMDRDTTAIGGISNPLLPTRQLFIFSVAMDLVAICLSVFISTIFAIGIILYILASRAYSYRGIRLKKFPVTGYLVVIIFQGAATFFLVYHGTNILKNWQVPLLPTLAATLLIGGYYPLTQVYQHEADRKDHVKTISMLLGIKGTFIYCGIVFALATLVLFCTFFKQHNIQQFYLFVICMLPMILFFSWWMKKVWEDEKNANFKNSLAINVLAAICTSACFMILIFKNHFE
ncbi:MAG TPA: UbiA family prenyltransferase [Chitinophagaceae bacterium]